MDGTFDEAKPGGVPGEGGAEPPLSPTGICRLLATPERLRVVAALALGASRLDAIESATGMPARDVTKALTRLTAGGLVMTDGRSAWWLRPDVFADAARATVDPEEPDEGHGAGDPREAAVLRVFMPGGRLVGIPAGLGKRRIVLDQVARLFEPGRRYPEREVDAVLRAIVAEGGRAGAADATGAVPDHVSLRRYLVDEGFLDREAGVYWRAGGTVELG